MTFMIVNTPPERRTDENLLAAIAVCRKHPTKGFLARTLPQLLAEAARRGLAEVAPENVDVEALVARVRALTDAGNALAERTSALVDWFEAGGYPRAADDPNVAALAAWRIAVGGEVVWHDDEEPERTGDRS